MKLLDRLIKEALRDVKKDDLRIDNIILGKSYYTMKDSKKIYSDMNLCLVLLGNAYGFSYYQGVLGYKIEKIINRSIVDVINEDIPHALKTALADALYCCLEKNNVSNDLGILKGDLRSKAAKRAALLTEGISPGSKVLLIGAVSEIIELCLEKNFELTVTDLEPSKIRPYMGVRVADGKLTLDKLKDTEYAIVSGMTFVTDTVDEIFKVALRNNVKLIFFMETGSNFGKRLINYGAYKVLSEYFPFYDFYGDTRYRVFTKS